MVIAFMTVTTSAFAVPALEISIPVPMLVNYSKANNTAVPGSIKTVLVNIQLSAGNCTAAAVTGLGLGKDNDKNNTNYPFNKACTTGAFTYSLDAHPNDFLPATAAADFGRFCASNTRGGIVSIPMKAILWGTKDVTIAKADVNIPFNVTCSAPSR